MTWNLESGPNYDTKLRLDLDFSDLALESHLSFEKTQKDLTIESLKKIESHDWIILHEMVL